VIFTTLDAVLSTARWRCGISADMCPFVLVVSSHVRGLVCSKATTKSTNIHTIDVVLHAFKEARFRVRDSTGMGEHRGYCGETVAKLWTWKAMSIQLLKLCVLSKRLLSYDTCHVTIIRSGWMLLY